MEVSPGIVVEAAWLLGTVSCMGMEYLSSMQYGHRWYEAQR
jgi:hypothetical protein